MVLDYSYYKPSLNIYMKKLWIDRKDLWNTPQANTLEIFHCLKRERDICIQTIIILAKIRSSSQTRLKVELKTNSRHNLVPRVSHLTAPWSERGGQGWITCAHVRDLMARVGANGLGTTTTSRKWQLKFPSRNRAMASSNRLRRPWRVSPARVRLIN